MDKDKIKACKTLDELVKLWENEAGHDDFCPDGFIDQDTFEKQEKKVLFIAKESNVSKGTDKDFFWLQSVVHGDSVPKILSRRILIMTNALFSNDFDTVKKDRDSYNILEKIAYMNINKCGGSSRTNATKLWDYANNHKDYIKREIELIDPHFIVCCGKLVYEIITNILGAKIDNCKVIEVYHPSYFFISDKKYLERFKTALDASQHQT